MDDFHVIPTFIPQFVKENSYAMDWNSNNVIAFASGCCCNFALVEGRKFQRICSAEFPPNPISCLCLHPFLPRIALGDNKGRIFLFDYEKREILTQVKSSRQDACICMQWYNNHLLVLTKGRRFNCLKFLVDDFLAKNENSDLTNEQTNEDINPDMRTVKVEWEISVGEDFCRFSIDPHIKEKVLFSGSLPFFAIYKLTSIKEKPNPDFETVTISGPEKLINFVQWSYSLPGYAYVVLDDEILLFHTESKCVVPILSQTTSSDPYMYICQAKDDYSRIIIFLRKGSYVVKQLLQLVLLQPIHRLFAYINKILV